LSLHPYSAQFEFMTKAFFIRGLEQAGPERSVDLDGAADDRFGHPTM
jgi:hypothetical protein